MARRNKESPLGEQVRQVMLRNFVHAEPSLSAFEAERLMRTARIRHLPIVSGGKLCGILSYRDLLEFALARLERDSHGMETIREQKIESLMTREPVTAAPETTLREAALRMLRHRIGCLPIVEADSEGEHVVGLLTESDLIRAALRPPKP